MSRRLVIEVLSVEKRDFVRVGECPHLTDEETGPTQLGANPERPPYVWLRKRPLQKGIVRICGKDLWDCMVRNGDVRLSLERISSNEDFPIFFRISSPDCENLPWEAIWRNTTKFIALRPNWPIARLTSSPNDTVHVERCIEPQLKVLAVFGAEGIDPCGEWNALYETLRKKHKDRVLICAVVGHRGLYDQIDAYKDPLIELEYMGSARSLVERIKSFAPNLVHFFCHGVSGLEPRIELCKLSQEIEEVTATQLEQLAAVDSVWLVTLNCCQGGRSTDHARSIARRIVAKGVPAAVAMRESIAWADANVFTAAFYDSVATALVAQLPKHPVAPNTPAFELPESIWLQALEPSRDALHRHLKSDPEDCAEWTWPILYVRRGGLHLKPRPSQPDPRLAPSQASQLADLRAAFQAFRSSGFPEEGLAELAAAIEALEHQQPPAIGGIHGA